MPKYQDVAEYMAQLPDDRRGVGDEMNRYAFGKGTIRFSVDDPIPLELVTRSVAIRRREVEEEAGPERP